MEGDDVCETDRDAQAESEAVPRAVFEGDDGGDAVKLADGDLLALVQLVEDAEFDETVEAERTAVPERVGDGDGDGEATRDMVSDAETLDETLADTRGLEEIEGVAVGIID